MNSDESDSKIASPDFTPRRATRNRTKPKKYDEFFESSPIKRRSYKHVESSDEDFSAGSTPKPKALFSSDDVEGQDIFKFKSRHTKHDLQNKVKAIVGNVAHSPLKTPKKNMHLLNKINEGNTQTPKHFVDKMKKKIIAELENSSESDFSGSSSDFVPDKSDESGSSSSESNSESQDEEVQPKIQTGSQFTRNKNRTKTKDSEYFVTPDNYFMMNSTKKITTSDHTLARLKNMRIEENDRDAENYMSPEHGERVADLVRTYDRQFDRWLYVLNEGFNILLYGVGSKRAVVRRFLERLGDAPCVIVNGFFPGLTVRSILDAIAGELLGNARLPSAVGDTLALVARQLAARDTRVCVALHNADGRALRGARAQAALASLAALPHVRLIATVDHINAPLLWEQSKLAKYRFVYFDVTSFLPYEHEAGGIGRAATAGGQQLAALRGVYSSLTANARGIFDIIVDYQLENHERPHYRGVPLKDLYAASRERFLCSSDAALRAHLAEFLDHRVLRVSRLPDGDYVRALPHYHALRAFRDARLAA